MHAADLLPRPLKSLLEFYAQRRRVTALAFSLAERPGLEGNLSRRLYYLCLVTEKLEQRLLVELRAAGRCVDQARSQAAAEWLCAFRERQGLTAIRATVAKELRNHPRYGAQVERDWLTLAALNATTDKTQLVVVDEHTLGYIDPRQPHKAGVLAQSVLRGAPAYPGGEPIWLSGRTVRLATAEDFDTYRVQFDSWRDDPEYVYQR